MKIKNKDLIIQKHDLDHILSYDVLVEDVPSEKFKEGLKIELELHGLENEEYERIVIELDD